MLKRLCILNLKQTSRKLQPGYGLTLSLWLNISGFINKIRMWRHLLKAPCSNNYILTCHLRRFGLCNLFLFMFNPPSPKCNILPTYRCGKLQCIVLHDTWASICFHWLNQGGWGGQDMWHAWGGEICLQGFGWDAWR